MAGPGVRYSASAVPVWLDEEDLCCSICHSLFNHPTTLPCGHSFCSFCIEQHWEFRGPPWKGAAWGDGPATLGAKRTGWHCPLCRDEVWMRPWLKKNTTLQDLVNKYSQALEEAEPRDPFPNNLPALQEPEPMKEGVGEFHQELEGLLEQLASKVTKLQCLGPVEESKMSEDAITPEEKNFNLFQRNINEILSDIKELKKKCQEKLWKEAIPEKIKGSILPTFDLRTASQYLEISENGQKVTVSPYRLFYPKNQERFQNSQVLCCQGFSSGQQYWEVNTQHCTGWAIGVATRDITTCNHQLGRTEHSWCVEWAEASEQLFSWHRKKETFISKDRPPVVGVMLDLEGNQLSFYSVTTQEKLLYKFELPASMPVVFPAFWLYGLKPGNSLFIDDVRGEVKDN